MLANKEQITAAADLIAHHMQPTAQHCWPLLSARCRTEVWVKHENHTPTGAFKVRGGLIYMDSLQRRAPNTGGVITATRGNHGQSVAFAARSADMTSVVVVPHGNSREKNAAMQAFGAELIEHGKDFNESMDFAKQQAEARNLVFFPSFDPDLVAGVATYTAELLTAVPDLDVIYVPIGLGSGICGVMSARDALGSKADVIGVVAEDAPTYALSCEAGKPVPSNSADTFADGLAVRIPDPRALDAILAGAARVVTVSEDEMKAAVRHYYTDTHNLVEGAGAASLAALLQEKDAMSGKKVGLILSGGNIDRELYR
ncbi:MAG: threonine dehydratase, partial [Pseudomonadota bacterium]|nr:threonine dehydratase [Pseudomonadota bacterium]